MADNEFSNVSVYLSFSGYDGDLHSISAALGIEPCSILEVGQKPSGRTVPITRSFWTCKLAEEESIEVGLLVDKAIIQLEDKAEQISNICRRTKVESYIGVTVRLGTTMPSINISQGTLSKIGAMGLNLDIGLFG